MIELDSDLLFDRHPHPMWIVDQETLRFVAANDSAQEWYQYSCREFLTMRVSDIAADGYSLAGRTVHRRKDGSLVEVDVRTSRIEYRGRPATLAEISDASVPDYVHEFLGLLGHELRNPLAAIVTAMQVLRRMGAAGRDIETMYSVIESSSSQLRDLINRFLEVSRISRGKMLLDRSRTDLAGLARRALDRHRPALAAAGLTVADDLPDRPLWVLGDSSRLDQVIDQAIDNARKFSSRGDRVLVSATARGEWAEVTIRDSGEGMSRETLRATRETFRRSGTDPGSGLGLGLPLARGLVELHGGQFVVRSEGPGRGTEVTIRLPLEPSPANELAAGQAADAWPLEAARG